MPPSADWINPFLSLTAPRETTSLVSKQLTFHEFGRDRAAIDRYEGSIAPRSRLVDEFCDQFLTGARLTEDVHGSLAARDAADHFAHVLHGEGRSQQAGSEDAGVAVEAPRHLDRGRHQLSQSSQIERLRYEVERAELQRTNRSLHIAMCSDDGNRDAGRVLLHPLDQIQAVAVRKLHIREAQFEILGLEQALGRRPHCRPCADSNPFAAT